MNRTQNRSIVRRTLLTGALLLWAANWPQAILLAQNTTFTYQGHVTDNGTNFTGAGLFKFALVTSTNANQTATATAHLTGTFVTSCTVDFGGSGYSVAPAVSFSGGGGSGAGGTATISGGAVTAINITNAGSGYATAPSVTIAPPPQNLSFITYWSNDGTSGGGSEPSAAVSVSVVNGVFTVALGDTTLANMAALSASLFGQPNLQLRIWFNDGVHGSVALSPVQNLSPAPYAIAAQGLAGVLGNNTIGPGPNATVGGGSGNISSNSYATVGGGYYNSSTNIYTTVAGGSENIANGSTATVAGGANNVASGAFSTVAGGFNNTSSALATSVGGGYQNWSSANYSTIGGGSQNRASGIASVVAGGGYNGTFVVGNVASGLSSVVSGGSSNTNNGDYSTITGGYGGTTTALASTVCGGYVNRADGIYSIVCGGSLNVASGYYSFAAGQLAHAVHTGSFVWSDVSAGAFSSTANNQFSVRAAGGVLLAADVQIGTGAGDYHRLSLGGGNASGFLYGSYPKWGDGVHLGYNYYADASGADQVLHSDGATSRISAGYGSIVLATGGVGLPPTTQRLVVDTSSVTVNGTFNNNSDRNAKQNFAAVNSSQILERVAELPLSEWSYKDDATTRHIGPMAQDFRAAFRIGTDDKHIAPIDEGGVALAAIQALNSKLNERETEILALKARLEKLEQFINQPQGGSK
jgi:hypothetical protein